MVVSKTKQDDDSDVDVVPQVDESLPDESGFKEPQDLSGVSDEESISGDTSDAEPADIDEELRKVGISTDNEKD